MAVVRIVTGDWETAAEEVAKGYIEQYESWGASRQHSVELAKQFRAAVRGDHTTPGQMVNKGIPNATGQETGYH